LRAETQIPALVIDGRLEAPMTYTLEQTEEMERTLRALPAMDSSKRRLNKQAVVKRLSRELAALQARGYTMEQIAECLRGIGFEISTPTLKSYLQRVKKRSGKDAPKRQSRDVSAAAPPTREREAPSAAATEPKADGTATRSGKEAFLVKDKDSY
jgi:ribosomal protein L12E/L44/L45/RPP1/RPP2